VGFTPAGIAAFDDLRPAAVVRELIQNSLDAAMAAGEPTAIVRFRLWRCDTDEVPGLDAYADALWAAIEFHERRGQLPSKASRVVETICEALESDELVVLSVLDNGVGLDERRMSALLSDGVSAKDASSAGTYGNGHSVAIPASDLRYALYGGLTANGNTIAAGHAVLASHVGNHPDFTSSGDGFLVHGFQNGRDGNLFVFARGDDLPPLIQHEIDDISQMSDHGTAVILPAFNSFRETKRSVADLVLEAAACNFFVALQEDRLQVWVEDPEDGEPDRMLDASTLADTLSQHRERKRSRAFLSGARAYDAHRACCFGKREVVETSQGEVEIRLIENAETTRIDLCRNGMWIADDTRINSFQRSYFTDRVPFHAVLVLDAEQGGRLHKLVRDAEGPLHDTIRLKDLSRGDRRDLKAAFGEIREWILANTRKIDGDSFGVDDYLALDFGDSQNPGGSGSPGYVGMPRVVKRRVPTWHSASTGAGRSPPKSGHGSGRKDKTRSRRSTVLHSAFQVISVPEGRRRRRIRVVCSEACEDAVLRLRVNENVDATCDSLWYEVVPAILENVRIDGRRAKPESLVHRSRAVRQNGEENSAESAEVVGIRLGRLAAGASIEIETGYRVPREFGPWRGADPSLAVEVVEGGFVDPSSRNEEAQEDGRGSP